MKKRIIIPITLFFVLAVAFLIFKNKQETPIKNIKKTYDELLSYEVEGTLEFVDEESLRKIYVTSKFKCINNQDYFYVRLEDSSTKQVQTIIRNKDGVFVISQGFNRAFKFNTDWPFNSFKPYILQNVYSALLKENDKQEIRDGYIFTSPIVDEIKKDYTSIQVLMNQNNALQQVNIIDKNGNERLSFVVTTYILNPEVDDKIFEIKQEDTSAVSINEDIPIYPLESYDAELIDHLKTNEGHILRYKGDKYFILIEKTMTELDEISVEEMEGDFYLDDDSILISSNNHVLLIKDGVQTAIYSEDLTLEEKRNVLLSIENYVVIEE